VGPLKVRRKRRRRRKRRIEGRAGAEEPLVIGGAVGFAMRLSQYFKRPDIRKELTRYARRSLLSQNNPFVRRPGWRRGAFLGE